ncbi:peptidase S10, serine carboxypeptidase, alpha/beta hydrolase fold protein [Tanacetum coccineum]
MDSNFTNENDPWEYSLDIDDSDLHLTPVLRSSSSAHVEPSPYTPNPVTIIPGPAGVVLVQRASCLKKMYFILDPDVAFIVDTEYMQKLLRITVTGCLGDIDNFLKKGVNLNNLFANSEVFSSRVSLWRYVGVGEHEDVEFFYYFAESQRNPLEDPLLLYLSGGPGVSGFSSFIYQIGPLSFNLENCWKNNITLELNPNTWTKMANMIFVDMPAGVGFSYAKTWEASRSSDSLLASHVYDFLRKGYLMVSPFTDKFADFNSRIELAHRLALISDDIYKSAIESCHGNYVYADPSNALCANSIQRMNECIGEINLANTLEPFCALVNPEPTCAETTQVFSEVWANNKDVQKALNIRQSSKMDKVSEYSDSKFLETMVSSLISCRGAGHVVALSKPEEALFMVNEWLDSHVNLNSS